MTFIPASNKKTPFDSLSTNKGLAAGMYAYDPATQTWQPYVKDGGDNPLQRQVRLDAFGRQRVSNPHTIFDSKLIKGKAPLFFSEVTGLGTETAQFNSGDASVTMGVSASGEYVIRQTKMRFNYQPGKSHEFKETFVFGEPASGTIARFGYYNSATGAPYDQELDGIFLERDDTGIHFCIAKTGNVHTRVHQSNWNIDPFTGSGPSQVTLDWTKGQIFHCDFEWLGVGDPLGGFVVNRELWPALVVNNANVIDGVYMSSPNHSLRCELRSYGGTSTMKAICGEVVSEGGIDPQGVGVGISTQGTGVSVANNTDTAILAVRLKENSLSATTIPSFLSVLASTKSNFEWWVSFNPLISGSYTWADKGDTAFQFATGPYVITGRGHEIGNAYVSESDDADTKDFDSIVRLGAAINGTRDVFALCVRPLGGNETFFGSFNFKELSIG